MSTGPRPGHETTPERSRPAARSLGSARPRSQVGHGSGLLIRRSWVRVPPGVRRTIAWSSRSSPNPPPRATEPRPPRGEQSVIAAAPEARAATVSPCLRNGRGEPHRRGRRSRRGGLDGCTGRPGHGSGHSSNVDGDDRRSAASAVLRSRPTRDPRRTRWCRSVRRGAGRARPGCGRGWPAPPAAWLHRRNGRPGAPDR